MFIFIYLFWLEQLQHIFFGTNAERIVKNVEFLWSAFMTFVELQIFPIVYVTFSGRHKGDWGDRTLTPTLKKPHIIQIIHWDLC